VTSPETGLQRLRRSSWIWLLVLFTIAGFVEAAFWSQMVAFTTALGIGGLALARRHEIATA
jgi:hypothetical protein